MESQERLAAAVKAKDPIAVRALVAEDPELARATLSGGLRALHLALYLRATQVVDALLAAGAEPNAFEAAILGDVPRLRRLAAENRGLLAAEGPDGACPLHLAAHFGQVDAVRALLDMGAPVDGYSGGVFGNTALHAAAAGGQAGAADALLQAGARANVPDRNGYAAAHVAAAAGSVAILRALAAGGADLRARARDGKVPEDLAHERGMDAAVAFLRTVEVQAGGR